MLSIEKCKAILNKNGKKYSDEETKAIREFLYLFAELDYQNFVNGKYDQKSSALLSSVVGDSEKGS